MSNNLDDLRLLLRKSLSVLSDPSLSSDPDFSKISMRINECVNMYNAIVPDNNLFGAGRKGFRPAIDVNDVAALIETVIAEQQSLEGVLERDRVLFQKSFADNPSRNPVITWKVIKRTPGVFEQSKISEAKGHREHNPHLRAVTTDPTDIGYSIFHYSQVMDTYLEFMINANDSAEVDRVALWFENLIEQYKWFFSFQGLNRIFFIERQREEFENNRSNLQYRIPMIYFIRTEKTISIKTKDIENITIDICVTK